MFSAILPKTTLRPVIKKTITIKVGEVPINIIVVIKARVPSMSAVFAVLYENFKNQLKNATGAIIIPLPKNIRETSTIEGTKKLSSTPSTRSMIMLIRVFVLFIVLPKISFVNICEPENANVSAELINALHKTSAPKLNINPPK